jgi:hypothetical protein
MRPQTVQWLAATKQFVVIAAIALAQQPNVGRAADPIPPGAALAHFAFEGTSFSTTLSDFQRRYPAAFLSREDSDEKTGVRTYVLVSTKASDGARFIFLDQHLCSVNAVYYADRVNKMGGSQLFVDKVLAAFGQPAKTEQNDNRTVVAWSEAGRAASLILVPESIILTVTNDDIEAQMQQRRAKQADFGF